MPYTLAQKQASMRWREKNKEKYNEANRRGQAKYKIGNRDKHNERELNRYYEKKFYNINVEIKRLSNLYKIFE
jgi:hypothetical protein